MWGMTGKPFSEDDVAYYEELKKPLIARRNHTGRLKKIARDWHMCPDCEEPIHISHRECPSCGYDTNLVTA